MLQPWQHLVEIKKMVVVLLIIEKKSAIAWDNLFIKLNQRHDLSLTWKIVPRPFHRQESGCELQDKLFSKVQNPVHDVSELPPAFATVAS